MTDTVLIVGGGPVGLINALMLGRAGIDVTVIEAEDGVVESPRAMGYHWCVLDGLDLLGLLEDMKTEGFVLQDSTFRVFSTGEQIVLNSAVLEGTTDHPYMLVLGQNKLARVILKHASAHPNITIDWGTKFTGLAQDGEGVTVRAERGGEPITYRTNWVIGTDGARSGVRKALGLGFEGITWPHRFVATNIYYDFEKYGWGQMGYLIDPKFGTVVGKLDKAGLWRVTYSEDATLPAETVGERIPAYMDAILPGDKRYELALYTGYNMHQRSAATYRKGRVLLAGDAAHATNPTSGFGLVGGLYDSFSLSEALSAVISGKASATVLDQWAEARRRVFHEVTTPVSSESMRLVFHSDDPVRFARDLEGLRALSQNPEALIQWYQTPTRLETPSLITGKTLRQRRAETRAPLTAQTAL